MISRTEFLVSKVFYNAIYSNPILVYFKEEEQRNEFVGCLLNTSTLTPDGRSRCLCCFLPIIQCAFGAFLDVGLAQRQSMCRFVGTLHVSFANGRERRASLIKRYRSSCGSAALILSAVCPSYRLVCVSQDFSLLSSLSFDFAFESPFPFTCVCVCVCACVCVLRDRKRMCVCVCVRVPCRCNGKKKRV